MDRLNSSKEKSEIKVTPGDITNLITACLNSANSEFDRIQFQNELEKAKEKGMKY